MKLKELIFDCPKQYEDLKVNNITDDSRKVTADDLFVCINGPVADVIHNVLTKPVLQKRR